MDLELRDLRAIRAIAETGSLSKAATALRLTQSALVAQLARIERILGGRLFERDRRGARPTPLGDLVLARASVLIPAVDDLRDQASRLVGSAGGARGYRIGAMNGPIGGGLIQRLSAAEPDAQVTSYSTWSAEELSARVRAGRLDYAVVGVCGESHPTGADGLAWRTVAVDAVCVLLSEEHPLASAAEVELGDLADEQWANAPGDGCFSECFAAACSRAGFTPRRIYEADASACADLVATGTAIVLVQGTTRDRPGAVVVPIAGTPLRWRHLLGWCPGTPAERTAEEATRHAVAAYRETVNRRPWYADWLRRHPDLGAPTDNGTDTW
nr:LysR family transcriptional regulator [Micromonospora sp. DSM 115978]